VFQKIRQTEEEKNLGREKNSLTRVSLKKRFFLYFFVVVIYQLRNEYG